MSTGLNLFFIWLTHPEELICLKTKGVLVVADDLYDSLNVTVPLMNSVLSKMRHGGGIHLECTIH